MSAETRFSWAAGGNTGRDRMEHLKVHSFMQQSGLSGGVWVYGQCAESRIGETLEALVFFSLPRIGEFGLASQGRCSFRLSARQARGRPGQVRISMFGGENRRVDGP